MAPAQPVVKTPQEVLQAIKDRLQKIEWDRTYELLRYEKYPNLHRVPTDPPGRLAEMRDIRAAIKRQEKAVAAEESKKVDDGGNAEDAKKEEDDEDTVVVDTQRK